MSGAGKTASGIGSGQALGAGQGLGSGRGPGGGPVNPLMRARGPFGIQAPSEKPKDAVQTIKRVWDYLEKQKIYIVAAIFFVIISTILGLMGPYLIGMTIDEYIIPMDLVGTKVALIKLVGVYASLAIFTWLQQMMMVRASLLTIRQLRQDLFDKLHTLSLRFFDQRADGDLMSRVTNDIDSLNTALSQSIVQIVSTTLMVVGIVIVMFMLNWALALITLTVIPIMIFTTRMLVKYSASYFIKRQRSLGMLNGFVEESITASDIIALFGQEERMTEDFNKINQELREASMSADRITGFLGPLNNFVNSLGLALLIGMGALMTISGTASIGVIASFVAYSRQFYRPINQLSNLFNLFQAAIAGAERVFEIMDEDPELSDRPGALAVDKIKGDIEFKGVNFHYEEGKPILHDVSFSAPAGTTVALVGPTGSGKTTIINLLMRFYDITSGEIKIDGREIKDYQMADLRKRIGVVLQDTFLFSGTIMDNIRYGRLDASPEEVMQAAKLASAHQFIRHLPNGYETKLVSGGYNLSQGQRQLIAIARAILADSDILILDEATSSIDITTEVQIQRGLAQLTQGRTSLVIAHRLRTIENADLILVIKDGRIIERGNHRELLGQEGFYYQMYQSQIGAS